MSDGNSPPVRVRSEGDVAVITLDDGKANVLGHDSVDALLGALDGAEALGAGAVVLAGRPGRFSAGFDLKAIEAGADEARGMLRRGVDLFLRCYMFPRPVVAACTGHAIAAGAMILLSSDLRIGARGDFRIGLPEVTIGMPLPLFATELARDRISRRHLNRATALGTMFEPDEAVEVGFLDEAVEPDDVLATAVERASALTGISQDGLIRTRTTARGAIADAIRAGLEDDLAQFTVGS